MRIRREKDIKVSKIYYDTSCSQYIFTIEKLDNDIKYYRMDKPDLIQIVSFSWAMTYWKTDPRKKHEN